jgi:iron complex outermembrane receptor protein
VFSPSFVSGFDMSLDWWKIKLTDVVSGIGGSEVLDECYLNGNNNACQLVTRGQGGQITTLIEASLNRGKRVVEGYDLTMNYRLPSTAFGRFSGTWDTTYLAKYANDDGENLVGRYFDRDNYWRIRSNLNLRWDMGDFGATVGTRYYHRQVESCADMSASGFGDRCSNDDAANPDNATNKLGSTTYHDVSVYWKSPWKGRFTLGVNNINAKNPPTSYSTFAIDPAPLKLTRAA